MSDTPRTDAAIAAHRERPEGPVVQVPFARELERENIELRAAITALPDCRCERSLDQQCELSVRLERAKSENAALRAEIAQLEAVGKAIDAKINPVMEKATRIFHENERLRAQLADAQQCIEDVCTGQQLHIITK